MTAADVEPTRVLFVCTGNICRSPSAEAVTRALAGAAGLDRRLRIESAGTTDFHVGEPPDRRAIAAASRRGYDLRELRARQVRRQDFDAFDLILAMDRGHLRELERMRPRTAAARVHLFLEFAPPPKDVPDPYYGSDRGFEQMLDLIEAGARGLLDRLREGRVAP